ncbi:hypothetical protein Hanom_Chr00s000002g01599471 [Helianthus anomalus]
MIVDHEIIFVRLKRFQTKHKSKENKVRNFTLCVIEETKYFFCKLLLLFLLLLRQPIKTEIEVPQIEVKYIVFCFLLTFRKNQSKESKSLFSKSNVQNHIYINLRVLFLD